MQKREIACLRRLKKFFINLLATSLAVYDTIIH